MGSVNLVDSEVGLISGSATTFSTQTLVDRSSVRLSRDRVTTVDVGPLAVGSGLSGDRKRPGAADSCPATTSTFTGDSSSTFVAPSSLSAVLNTSTVLCAADKYSYNTNSVITLIM